MTRTNWAAVTAVVLALLFAGAATVASAGPDKAPAASATPSVGSADAGFARDMAVHHQQAVEMSFLVRDGTDDEEVRRLAYDIANTQANQRGMLLGWLDMWKLPKAVTDQEPMAWMADDGGHPGKGDAHGMDGMDGMEGTDSGEGMDHGGHEVRDGSLMPGMATRTEMEALRTAKGEKAEILYLQLMTDHHKGGVTMARGCAESCEFGTERTLAEGMVAAQQSELNLMADLLKARGAKPRS
ncbi:DUF305 domain-containing protein [Streptomyces sp. NBC_01498]|uniref:DUF305 domain-containing protein n=1 Tax=Streptomyces sp. NBC_01498 TaxID=2975870 RepID=UPI002E7B3170|nr:DUF305 domain-containing protein [Streptomyces sp. NBC_01498]WTL27192.1 DUF305 domain-containing protein [Streptomyces sp. NBC_01498]